VRNLDPNPVALSLSKCRTETRLAG